MHDAENFIAKAIRFHSSGEVHDSESFPDPAMKDLNQTLVEMHAKTYQKIIEEISEALDQDYRR